MFECHNSGEIKRQVVTALICLLHFKCICTHFQAIIFFANQQNVHVYQGKSTLTKKHQNTINSYAYYLIMLHFIK